MAAKLINGIRGSQTDELDIDELETVTGGSPAHESKHGSHGSHGKKGQMKLQHDQAPKG